MKVVVAIVVQLLGCVHAMASEPGGDFKTLERKLHGTWEGGACVGDYTFYPDGTYDVRHFTPGGNNLTGTWSLRWNDLPPTLALTCTSSDFRRRTPDREEYEFLGKTLELKVVKLVDQVLAIEYPGDPIAREYMRGESQEHEELAAIQGTWVPLEYEERGQSVQSGLRHIIKGDKLTVQINGETAAEAKVVLDVTKHPKQMDIQFTSGQTDLIIYSRIGRHMIYSGNRDGKTRPAEFASGTPKGGEYLLAWKIER